MGDFIFFFLKRARVYFTMVAIANIVFGIIIDDFIIRECHIFIFYIIHLDMKL